AFIAGSVAAVALLRGAGVDIPFESATPAPWLIAGGLIVGVGVYYGSGCTSGHGVCGMARLSPRSIAATLVFMLSTGVTVYLVRHVFGGF
ncbi:MAG: YeeE/YedE thiosulfate transporter family protein, partial [Gemmobacter sp.]